MQRALLAGGALSVGDLKSLLEQGMRDVSDLMTLHLEVSQFAVFLYELLRKLAAKWLGDSTGSMAAQLVTGMAGLKSALPGREIFGLSRQAAQSQVLREIFSGTPLDHIGQRLEAASGPDASSFRDALSVFFQQHGYRGLLEAEWMAPSWEEDPRFVYSAIRNCLVRTDLESPEASHSRRTRERNLAESRVDAQLPLWKRAPFRWVLGRARQFILLRESMKTALVMSAGAGKILSRRIGRRLAEEGSLADPQDLYFLREAEILAVLDERELSKELRQRVERRKREYRWNRQVGLPDHFAGRPRPLRRPPEPVRAGEDRVLRGTPISPGRVMGRACIVEEPGSREVIQAGEILVAAACDAAWAPLFLLAAGLVVEKGGLLSHGSIVAREYGIPLVANVKDATKLIRPGQRVLVDGDQGVVQILDRSSHDR